MAGLNRQTSLRASVTADVVARDLHLDLPEKPHDERDELYLPRLRVSVIQLETVIEVLKEEHGELTRVRNTPALCSHPSATCDRNPNVLYAAGVNHQHGHDVGDPAVLQEQAQVLAPHLMRLRDSLEEVRALQICQDPGLSVHLTSRATCLKPPQEYWVQGQQAIKAAVQGSVGLGALLRKTRATYTRLPEFRRNPLEPFDRRQLIARYFERFVMGVLLSKRPLVDIPTGLYYRVFVARDDHHVVGLEYFLYRFGTKALWPKCSCSELTWSRVDALPGVQLDEDMV